MQMISLIPGLDTEKLKCINGNEFENLCLQVFRFLYQDYHVQKTDINDFGADILINMDCGRKMVVQCKTSENAEKMIGVKAVQEVIAAKKKYNAEFAIVVTNSCFTKQAAELAAADMVSLYAGEDLLNLCAKTIIEIADITDVHERLLDLFEQGQYTYADKFLHDPQLALQLTYLESVHLLSLVFKNAIRTRCVDMDSELRKCINYVVYMAALKHQYQ